MKILILIVLLTSCGMEEKKESEEKFVPSKWTADELDIETTECSEECNEMDCEEEQEKAWIFYCRCINEDISKRYTYDDYIKNLTIILPKEEELGTYDMCAERTKDYYKL